MENKLKIESLAFKNNGKIPSQYTCDGDNSSPALIFENIPPETVSLVLIVDDPDVSESIKPDKLWTHWIIWDIPPETKEIPHGGKVEGTVGKNSSGAFSYEGPCPPEGEHRYYFKLFALDTKLELPAETDRAQIEKAMEGHIIEQTELMGRYERIVAPTAIPPTI
jgi:Raf kinase inhibitor-like YbhB/YbcL family protein